MNEYVLVVKTLGTKRWLNSSRTWQQALNSNKDVKKKSRRRQPRQCDGTLAVKFV